MPLTRTQLDKFLPQDLELDRVVDVEITNATGSAPREAGAWMLVKKDQMLGTIGGGQLEYLMRDEARLLLKSESEEKIHHIPLGPEIGQCCGGHVTVRLQRLKDISAPLQRFENQRAAQPDILIFGAGHVGKALAKALSLLPVNICLVDQRADELADVEGVETCLSPLPESKIRSARPQSAIAIVTHDHALDFLIAGEALARKDFSYVGMIGSKTKRAVFANWLEKNGCDKDLARELICPIGGTKVKDKRPEIIAALTAAELITVLNHAHKRQIDGRQILRDINA